MADFLVHLKCIPPNKTFQAKRLAVVNGRARMFKPKAVTDIEGDFQALLISQQIPEPLKGPVALTVVVTWSYLKADVSTKAKAARTDFIPHTSKPDLDNFAKMFIDQLVTMRFLEDDKQVVQLKIAKRRGPAEKVGIIARGELCEDVRWDG